MREWLSKTSSLHRRKVIFIAVHAGLMPHTKLCDTPPHILMNIRTWDEKGIDLSNPKNKAWYEYYKGTLPIFYGHWARLGINIRDYTYGLDSGCVYGKKLSAYILEEKRLVQVNAKQVYCKI